MMMMIQRGGGLWSMNFGRLTRESFDHVTTTTMSTFFIYDRLCFVFFVLFVLLSTRFGFFFFLVCVFLLFLSCALLSVRYHYIFLPAFWQITLTHIFDLLPHTSFFLFCLLSLSLELNDTLLRFSRFRFSFSFSFFLP